MTLIFETLGMLAFLLGLAALKWSVAVVAMSIAEERDEGQKLGKGLLVGVIVAASIFLSYWFVIGGGLLLTHWGEAFTWLRNQK